jgi:hypothetical protein
VDVLSKTALRRHLLNHDRRRRPLLGHSRTHAWYERTRAAYGAPELYAEEYDVVQRLLRGNLPQAFVHAIGLECGLTLNHRLS